jgi:alpha-D-ribose 1-methylphosphonate 5-triphosphate synthase subunit PhnG
MYRIHRSATPETVVFALSGEVDLDHATRLQELLTNEATRRVTFDLGDVTLVDRAAVRFLAGAEAAGIRFVNCPDYIRSWIAAERDWQQEHPDEPDEQEGPP